ncbi:MAG: hypothetical protein N3E39_01110 [Candidatus Methanomethylicia archaeon]|nr:hypothetical protein [Candidatus Methanomethylicia archaeon]MDW7988547.1 hypothetical protein [Nitrososphaerota archaeon]
MSNNFSIPYSIITLILVYTSVFYPIIIWVDSVIHGLNNRGELYIDFLNYVYDSNTGLYVFNFKISNDYVEFINLIDVLINNLSFKGFGKNAFFSQLSQIEYDFNMIYSKNYANKFQITILSKSTIYLKLYIPKDIFNINDCMKFTFKFTKGLNHNNILSIEVSINR